MEAFTLKGVWWLPENPDHEITGILTFDPYGRSELELFGSYKEGFSKETRNQPIILGAGERGQAITLVYCNDLGTGWSHGQYVWIKPKYRVVFVIQGHHFKCVEDISFDKIWVKFYGLKTWTSSGLFLETVDFKDLPVDRSSGEDVSCEIADLFVTVMRGQTVSGDLRLYSKVDRYALIELSPASPWGLEEICSRVFHFQMFLSLAMRTGTWPLSIVAPNPSGPRWELSIHYSQVTDFQENDWLFRELMYFTLDSLGTDLEQCFRNWIAKSNKLEQTTKLYNLAISKRMFVEDTFLYIAKGVEAYHRQMHEETYIDETEFEELKVDLRKSIKLCIPSDEYKDLRRRIYQSMNLANSPSLHDRLADLREKHKGHNQRLFEDFVTFSDDVVSTRDYLTHYFDAGKSKARTDGPSLYYMSERLRLILELCLLSEMGFNDEELLQMARENVPQDPNRAPGEPQPES